jgi:TP901 family phage tail tape measure protein
MATSGLNYLISVQLDQLQGLQKLHDTIVGIQQLSQKGADFNVRVNASSLSALTREISDSVSKGFGRASANVASGGTSGPSVSVDTTKLESSISRLAEVVGRMGTGGGGGVAAPPSASRMSTASRNVLRELDEVIKMYDDVLAQRAEMTKEMAAKLRRYVTKISDPGAGEAGIRQDLLDFRERVASRAGRYGGSGTPGVAVDASVLKQVFESGSQQLAGAMRKGIEDATAGLSAAITDAVLKGFAGGGGGGGSPYASSLGAPEGAVARVANRYLGGLSTRDQGLFVDAAAGGVMALPQQYKELLTLRVRSTGEVLRIEEQIGALIRRRGKGQDLVASATDDQSRERYQRGVDKLQAEIAQAYLDKDRAITAALNRQIDSAVVQYRAVLAGQRGSNQITPDEYKRKIGALSYADERRQSLESNNPNINREMLLLPDALAQYIRETLTKYVEQVKRFKTSGQAIDPTLLSELQSNDFLANIAGRAPTDNAQAAAILKRLVPVAAEFGRTKTTYEFLKQRATIGLPTFNPNLNVDTAPYLPGEDDPGRLPMEDRERYLKTFLARGGMFASQTAERKAYAEKQLELMYQQQRAGTLGEVGERRLLDYQRELEFGGRYYYPQSGMARGIMSNGILMAPQESARVRGGGARSEVIGGSLGAAQAALSSETKAAQELYQAMGYVEGALGRVTRAIGDLGKVKFDPIVAEFQKLSAVLQPYAASLERVSKALDMQYAAKKITDAKAKQEAVEQAKTAGLADRLALAQSLGISVAGPAFAAPRPGSQSASGIPLISQDPETLRAMVLRGAKQIAGLQAKSQDLLSLEAAQLAAGLPSAATARRLGQTGAQYNATLGTFATNASALAGMDPRFFGRSSQDVIAASSGLLGAQGRSVQLGDEIRVLKTSLEQFKEIQGELKRLEGNKSDSANLRRQSLTDLRNKLVETRDASLDRLLKGGVLQPGEASSNTAKVLDTLKTKQRELNAEVAKYSDLLLKTTENSVKAEMAGGGFLDRVINKFQNLSAYLFAGGALFTIANQLRQASAAAIGLEADIARIQGVLSSKSAGQAGIIGSGIMGAASDYGVDLRQAVQSGKIFAQTGATPSQTVELTRAALAAQVGAGLEAGQATELLIAVENITNRQVKAFDILDRISKIESQYAVSAQDLSNAIQRAGSLATQLQPQALGAVDALDLIIGSATTIIERTRVTGEQAATSLRFIISRLAAPEVSRSLQDRFGIKLAGDDPNTLRPLQDILKDVADRYRQLRESGQTVQAQQLLTTFAGARQSNVAAALLEGFNDALRIAQESSLAYGDTQERVKIQLDTLQSKFEQFNTAFTGFAASLFNDTGLSAILKRLLDAGTAGLQASSSGLGAIGVGAGLGLTSMIARTGSTALLTAATNPGAARLTTTVAGGAATLLGGAGSVAATGGTILAIVGALELAARSLERIAKREDVRTAERFDRDMFRESPFFQAYQERALQFGLSTDDMSATFRAALTKADTQVQKELAAGTLRQDQSYNRTTLLLVEELDKTIPGFATLGDQAQRTAKALELLRESARYSAAIPQTYTNEFIKDLDNLTSEFDKSAPDLGRALRNSLTAYAAPGGIRNSLGLQQYTYRFNINEFSKQFMYAGRNWLNVGGLTAAGTGNTFQNLIRQGGVGNEIATLDNYARQFLLVSGTQRARLETIESQLRAQNKPVNATTVQGVLNADRSLTDAQRQNFGTAYYRLGNQRQLSDQIIQSMNTALGNERGQRLVQMYRDSGAIGTEPGEVFATAFRSAIEDARKKLIEFARSSNYSTAEIAELNAQLNRMADSSGRAAKMANLAITSISVRDRMFEPIVAYGSQMAEIGTRERISRRFGTSFDGVGARSQAAQQLLVGLDQVPMRLLQDRIREAARLVAGGTGTMTAEIPLTEDGGGARGSRVRLTESAMVNGFLLGRSDDIAKVNALKDQYISATQQGLGGFIEQGMNSDNAQLAAVAMNLKDALDALGAFGDVRTKDDLQELARLEGVLEEQRKQAIEVVDDYIDTEVRRTTRGREIARAGQSTNLDLQLAGNREQALLQARLGSLQSDPRMAKQALDTQLELLTVQRNVRVAVATSTRDNAIETARNNLAAGSVELGQAIADATATFDREVQSANSERALGAYGQVSQINTQLTRRRQEEANQLVQDLTSPLAELLSSSKNFSRAGYERAFEGVGQAAQRRLVDMFMKNTFSETGMLGATLRDAFNTGALSTQTAIEAGFTAGVAQLQAAMAGQLPGQLYNGEGAITFGGTGGADGAAAAGSQVAGKLTMRQRLGNFANAALPLAGSLLGGSINTGVDNSSAGEGAAIGAMIGNMIVPGLGGLAGGLLGGLFGSRIGKGDDAQELQVSALERIERNTRQQIEAIENQTKMLTLDSRFMNVPTGFTVPGFRPFGVGGGDVNLTVNISGTKGDAQETADLVSSAIRRELRGLGTSYNVLNN